MHTTSEVACDIRKRKMEDDGTLRAPPAKQIQKADGSKCPEKNSEVKSNSPKNPWGPIFKSREHFVDMHII